MLWQQEVKLLIAGAVKHPAGHELQFIGEHDLREVWIAIFNKPDEFILHYEVLQAKERITQSLGGGRLLQVASILVEIGWEKWETFKESFVDVPERSDAHLPFDSTVLSGVAGLDKDDFREKQYRFLSPRLQESQDHKVTSLHRLPFIQRQPLSRSNRVVKVRVAEGHCSFTKYGPLKEVSSCSWFPIPKLICGRIAIWQGNTAEMRTNTERSMKSLEQFDEARTRTSGSYNFFVHYGLTMTLVSC
jgi:hypothetical protein